MHFCYFEELKGLKEWLWKYWDKNKARGIWSHWNSNLKVRKTPQFRKTSCTKIGDFKIKVLSTDMTSILPSKLKKHFALIRYLPPTPNDSFLSVLGPSFAFLAPSFEIWEPSIWFKIAWILLKSSFLLSLRKYLASIYCQSRVMSRSALRF